MFGDPQLDDRSNARLAHMHGFCVVSIEHRLAPLHQFPVGPKDCATIVEAVMNDPELPIDKSKVVMLGHSAGGLMALSAYQLPELKGKIKGIVALYPPTNFAETVEQKCKMLVKTDKPDFLEPMIELVKFAYVPSGTDLAMPLLSPSYAERKDLPEKLLLMGCERDILCTEEAVMAERLAEQESGEKKAILEGNGWEKGGMRWEKWLEMEHGFDAGLTARNKEEKEMMLNKGEEMIDGIAEWLWREVFN